MRISFLLSSLQLSGGVRVVIEYANRLTARGHQITLVAPCGTVESEMLAELNPTVQIYQSQVTRFVEMNYLQLMKLTWSLAKVTPPSDVIISTHTPTTVVGLFAAHILRKGKLVWLFQDYPIMFQDRPIERWLMRYALNWHKMALTVSQYCQQELERYTKGRVVVVGEGLSDASLLRAMLLHKRAKNPQPIIFFLGDMRPRKGLADFLAAATIVYTKMPNIKLWIASKEMTEFVCQVPHQIIYRPNRAQLIELYSTCDLFVSASWCEGFGLPPLEAMACGTPVALTNSGGVLEYAISDINCVMVPPRAPHLLAEAILKVLGNRELASQLSQNGVDTAQRYTWEKAVDRFEAALQEIIG